MNLPAEERLPTSSGLRLLPGWAAAACAAGDDAALAASLAARLATAAAAAASRHAGLTDALAPEAVSDRAVDERLRQAGQLLSDFKTEFFHIQKVPRTWVRDHSGGTCANVLHSESYFVASKVDSSLRAWA